MRCLSYQRQSFQSSETCEAAPGGVDCLEGARLKAALVFVDVVSLAFG
jgi:hypothetical protein